MCKVDSPNKPFNILLYLLLTLFPLSCFASQLEEQFTEIYNRGIWGVNSEGEGTSGCGSLISTTGPYRTFLSEFFKTHDIQSVVDAGCGDWEFSRIMDWDNIDYKGFDVVKHVVERNQSRYTQEHINFFHANFLEIDLPPADLLICKDVLQHLPNEKIFAFLPQLSKYKYCLITNDVHQRTGTSRNPETDTGLRAYRCLDLTAPPFNITATKILNYYDAGTRKLVLLITN